MNKLNGSYQPFNDGYGIVGFHFICGNCGYINEFSDNEYCAGCDNEQEYVDPCDWYDNEMSKPVHEREWNSTKQV